MKTILILIIALMGCAKKPAPIIMPITPDPPPPPAKNVEPSLAPPVAAPEPPPPAKIVKPMPVIYFDFDKANIRSDQYAFLAMAAANANGKCIVTGHACPIGTDNYNYNLGLLRAQAVIDYLYEATGQAMFATESKGESLPVATVKSEYWRNRRVEVICK